MSDTVKVNGYDIKDLRAVRTYENVAAMKSDTKLRIGQHVKTKGYYTSGDGGSAEYIVKSSSSEYYEELTNELVAELVNPNNVYNILQLGCKKGSSFKDSNNIIINNLLKDNITITIPENLTIYLGIIEIKNNYVKFTGGGNVYASFKCIGESIKQHFELINLSIYGIEDYPCVEMSYLVRSFIKNCKFYNCDKAIMYDSIDVAQNVSRIIIDNNYFYNINYALYGEKPENGTQPLIVADIHFTNNMIEACKIQHLHLEGFDGGIISNNTMFFVSYMQHPANKTNNIYIDYCNWTIISNNNLFEAGTEAILIEHGQAVRIIGNNIAWSGQRQQSAGIRFTNYDISGLRYNISTISSNDVMFASGNAIKCDNNVGHINITSNNLFGNSSESAENYYYGNETYIRGLSSVVCDNTTTRIIIENNNSALNNMSNLSEYAITNNNIKLDHNDSNIRSLTRTVNITTSTTGATYGNVAIGDGIIPISIIPLYSTVAMSGDNKWLYNSEDNTIQVKAFQDNTATNRSYQFKIYYINNTN